jgi:hypothetical protein
MTTFVKQTVHPNGQAGTIASCGEQGSAARIPESSEDCACMRAKCGARRRAIPPSSNRRVGYLSMISDDTRLFQGRLPCLSPLRSVVTASAGIT